MQPSTRPARGVALALALIAGCSPSTPEGNPLEEPGTAAVADPSGAEFNSKLSDLMNETNARFRPVEYEFDEDLLAILDRVEARLSGKSETLEPLPMPKLDEAEQLAHFRETIRRWEAKTGKTLRAELDPLLAEVAARKPTGGPAFHPEFHKKFAAVFDDFIPIEVAEARERRNRALHEAARPLIEEYRSKAPEAVQRAEETLNAPPYNLPDVGK